MTLISVLSELEKKEFDNPPHFNSIDRKRFYDLTVPLQTALNKLKTPSNKIYFLISYAYFKAQNRFYDGTIYKKDIEYASSLLGLDLSSSSLAPYHKNTRLNHQSIILNIFDYVSFNNHNKEELTKNIYLQIKSYKSPRLIFSDMINYLLAKKVEIPYYRQFVNLISNQVRKYKSDIDKCLHIILNEETRNLLDTLINQENGQCYTLRFLKRYNQSLSPGNIRKNLEDFNNIKELYGLIEEPFKALNLNHDGAMYLTRFVERNKALHLSQRSDNTRYVSLIAFIAYQYFKGHDVLADILLQSVQTIKNSVREKVKDQNANNYVEQNLTFRNSVMQAKSSLIAPIEKIVNLTSNADLSPDECLLRIKDVLNTYKEPIDNYKKSLSLIEDKLSSTSTDNTYFSALETQSRKLQNRVAGIIKFVEFTGDNDLIEAIHNFQKGDIKENTAPVKFLSKKEREYLKDDKGNFRVSLYKALLFLKIADALKSGRINLPYSYKYRHINDYLILEEEWSSKRDYYLKNAGLEDMTDINKIISVSEKELALSYKNVNNVIYEDKSPYITCHIDGYFIVRTPKLENKETYSLHD